MIREEAINHLKTVAKTAIDSGYDSAVVDAVEIAIKAIEQEPKPLYSIDRKKGVVEAAKLIKEHCSKTQYCSLCLFQVEYPDQGGGSYCGCRLEHGFADFSMKCRPENWEV